MTKITRTVSLALLALLVTSICFLTWRLYRVAGEVEPGQAVEQARVETADETPEAQRVDPAASSSVVGSSTTDLAVGYFLERILGSGLRFGYNGKDLTPQGLAALLREDYRLARKAISSPADFITKVATRTINGHPYFAVDSSGQKIPLVLWLNQRLDDYDNVDD